MTIDDKYAGALAQILCFAKFSDPTTDKANELAGSSIVYNLLRECEHTMAKQGHSPQVHFIEENEMAFSIVESLIKRRSNWRAIKLKVRRELVRNMVYPYKCSEETMAGFLQI